MNNIENININNSNFQQGKDIYNTNTKIESRISDLENKVKNLKRVKKTEYVKLLILIVVFTFLFFIFAIILNRCFDFEISDNSILFTFIGIVATFIVISNYAQVSHIEFSIRDKINKVSDLEKNIEKRFSCIENDIKRIDMEIRNIINETTKPGYISDGKINTLNESLNDMIKHTTEITKGIDWIKEMTKGIDWIKEMTKGIDWIKNQQIKEDEVDNNCNNE